MSGARGFAMVELLVSLVLGLVVVAGAAQIFQASRRTAVVGEAIAVRQQALRIASMLLAHDLQRAGYRGCAGSARWTSIAGAGFLADFATPVQGADGGAGGWQPGLDVSVHKALPGTDVLTVRGPLETPVPTLAPMADGGSDIVVGRRAAAALAPADFALISDCSGAAVFDVAGVVPAQGLLTGGPGLARLRRFPAQAEVVAVATTTYFVRASASGSGPALWRRVGAGDAEELAEGIENLQVQYGEDDDRDLVADAFRPARAVRAWPGVVAVRVALLARSPPVGGASDRRTFELLGQRVGPFADGRLRSTATFTVALRNQQG